MIVEDIRIRTLTHCLYECPYYQDGNVFSYCNKYATMLSYSDYKPERCKKCIEEK